MMEELMAEEKRSKEDPELVKVIDEAIANSKDYLEALDKVIEWKKKNRGMLGMHVSPSLDTFLNPEKKNIDPRVEANNMAHDVLIMERSGALGLWREVTGEELERM